MDAAHGLVGTQVVCVRVYVRACVCVQEARTVSAKRPYLVNSSLKGIEQFIIPNKCKLLH